jgi:hypothetical protein
MKHQRKFIVVIAVAISFTAIAATIGKKNDYKNLKLLPKDISAQKLDSIMGAYSKALNVSCGFCHTPANDSTALNTTDKPLDYAADNSMKQNARHMIELTMHINQKYFYFDSAVKPIYLNVVSCNTCHRGNPYPVHE